VGRLTASATVAAALLLSGCELRDDDRPVDPEDPQAQRAVAIAREVVEGRLVDVRRDADNGKWEVTLRQGDNEYEVELAADDMTLLRIDYD
jgi:uncharacterized membrane protein YkoI